MVENGTNSKREDLISNLSVCITTRNSESTIKNTLESVDGWVDEIVVLDCSSSDDTLKIVKEYTDRIYSHEFDGFADLKREVVSKASNDWVFILDSDEEISRSLYSEVQNEFPNPPYGAYLIPIKNHMFGDWVRTSPSPLPRLARKEALIFEQDYIHEKISIKEGVKSKTLSGELNHYTYDRVSDYLRKFDQYTSLEAIKSYEDSSSPYLFKALGRGTAIFFYQMLVKGEILDGYRGLLFSIMSGVYPLVAYSKYQDIKRLASKYPETWRQTWLEEECQR